MCLHVNYVCVHSLKDNSPSWWLNLILVSKMHVSSITSLHPSCMSKFTYLHLSVICKHFHTLYFWRSLFYCISVTPSIIGGHKLLKLSVECLFCRKVVTIMMQGRWLSNWILRACFPLFSCQLAVITTSSATTSPWLFWESSFLSVSSSAAACWSCFSLLLLSLLAAPLLHIKCIYMAVHSCVCVCACVAGWHACVC